MIGKLQRLPLRDVWPHEAHDFTVWLTDNIDVLSEVIDLDLTNAEREQPAGSFNVDIVAEDASGNTVIIENQLEKSDHDHLGKLITYLTAFDARAAVWVVAEPRTEHVQAIAWLNEASSGAFYLVKVEAIRIGDSEPAPLLTVIVGPSEEATIIGKSKRELTERHRIRRRFWTGLLEHAKKRTNLHANVSPSVNNWITTGAGKSGLAYAYVVTQHGSRVELYINSGQPQENLAMFDRLAADKPKIEESFEEELDWQRLEEKRACRIAFYMDDGGWKDEDRWSEVFERSVNMMIRLEKALAPFVA